MTKKDDIVTIKLPRNDLGQMIDCLCVRRDNWRYTQKYLEDGLEESGRMIEECKDAYEAENIANHYDNIIHRIQEQWDDQKS